jgi:hypothetical protein
MELGLGACGALMTMALSIFGLFVPRICSRFNRAPVPGNQTWQAGKCARNVGLMRNRSMNGEFSSKPCLITGACKRGDGGSTTP